MSNNIVTTRNTPGGPLMQRPQVIHDTQLMYSFHAFMQKTLPNGDLLVWLADDGGYQTPDDERACILDGKRYRF